MGMWLKPPKSSWKIEEKIQHKIESLEAYAIDVCTNDAQKKTAGMILREMGLVKTVSSALNLLIDVGYFPVHVNLDLLKFNTRVIIQMRLYQLLEIFCLSPLTQMRLTERILLT